MQKNHMLVFWLVALSMSLLGFASHAKEPAGNKKTVAKKKRPNAPKEKKSLEDKNDRFIFVVNDAEVMLELERKIEGFKSSRRKDTEKNGFKYRQWVDENSVRRAEAKGAPSNPYHYISEEDSSGTKVILFDANGDGTPEKRAEKKPASHIYLLEHDTDGDGIFDERVTSTFDFEKDENNRVFEKRSADGVWEKTLEKTEPIHRVSYSWTSLKSIGIETKETQKNGATE